MSLLRSLVANQFRDDPASNMDVMGNYFGADTRANQTEANVKPQTTTIDYNQDGSVDVSQKKTVVADGQEQQVEINRSLPPQPAPPAPTYQVPELQQPVNPQQDAQASQRILEAQMRDQMMQQRAPQPQGPVAPDQTFQRMVQAESGGQQYNPQGGILTSPKGALGAAQIMPATAAQPGYGIAPATAEEIATKEGNLAFGQRYHQGMLKQFGGDQEKAVAAYNAGPGRVQQAVARAEKEGGTWKDYIPAETKTYLTDVFPKNQELAKRVEPMIAGMPSSDVGLTPTEQAIHQIALNSGDINAVGMGAYTGGNAIDPATRRAYADQTATLLEQQKQEAKAQRDIQTYLTDPTGRGGLQLANALKKESDEGSYLKAYLFRRLGLTDLAKEEQMKLGAGDTWSQTVIDGKPTWIKYNSQGAPVKGYNAEKELTPKELLTAPNAKGGLDIVGGTYINDQTKEVGRVVTNKSTGQSYIQTDTGLKPMTGFRPQSSTGSLADMKARQIQEVNIKLQGKTKEEQMAILRDYNKALVGQGYSPIQPDEVGLTAPQIPTTQTAPAQPAPAPAPGAPAVSQANQNAVIPPQGGPVAPAQPAPAQPAPQGGPAVPGATPAQPRPTMAQIQSQQGAQKEVGKAAAEVVANQAAIISDIEKGNTAIDILDNQKTNFGSILQGQIPGEQMVGKALGTKDARNTQRVMEYLDKVTAAGAKALGANPTDRDLQFLLANRPNEGWPAEDVKQWITSVQERSRASLEIARKQVESGGTYQPPIPPTGGGDTGIKIIKREKI